MNIILKTIPHSEQRYDTVGDWQELPDGTIQITVSDMGNEDYHTLVAVHELIECLLCRKRGITDEAVTEYDKAFEAAREAGDTSEPGTQYEAPYHKEHMTAEFFEITLARHLGVSWFHYENKVRSL